MESAALLALQTVACCAALRINTTFADRVRARLAFSGGHPSCTRNLRRCSPRRDPTLVFFLLTGVAMYAGTAWGLCRTLSAGFCDVIFSLDLFLFFSSQTS